jgi:predicted nucleic acid-binding protein
MAEPRWVLDTSIAVAWFFLDEPLREAALAVRAELREHPESYFVPHLFYSELAHVLARKSARDARFVRQGLALILRLGIRTMPLSEGALLGLAERISGGLSGYDATFVVLAEDLGARWLTGDARTAKVAGRALAVSLTEWARR